MIRTCEELRSTKVVSSSLDGLASHYTCKEREPSATVYHSGTATVGGMASSVQISRTMIAIDGVKANLTPKTGGDRTCSF